MSKQMIATTEELDALPQGAAILTANGYVYIATKNERHGAWTTLWQGDGVGRFSHLWMEKSGSLPATVLYSPKGA